MGKVSSQDIDHSLLISCRFLHPCCPLVDFTSLELRHAIRSRLAVLGYDGWVLFVLVKVWYPLFGIGVDLNFARAAFIISLFDKALKSECRMLLVFVRF